MTDEATTIPTTDHGLENGNRTSTPPGDNLVRDFALADAAAFAALARAVDGRMEHNGEVGLAMADCASPCPFGNVAHLLRPVDADQAESVVSALRGFFGVGSGRKFLFFSMWPTPDARFRALGLQLGGHPPLMLRPAGGAPDTGSALQIEVVTTVDQLEDFERTIVDAYPTPELAPFGSQPRLFGDPLLDSSWTLFVGYLDGRPVATAGAYVTDELVTVEMISVRSEHRGRGLGGEVTARAAATCADRPSVLISSDLGQPVYRRLGYIPILRQTLWVGEC